MNIHEDVQPYSGRCKSGMKECQDLLYFTFMYMLIIKYNMLFSADLSLDGILCNCSYYNKQSVSSSCIQRTYDIKMYLSSFVVI